MKEHIAKRLLWSIPTFFGAVTVIFLIMKVLPGDIAFHILSEGGDVDPVQLEALRQQLGLNQPVLEQYLSFLWGLVRLDLGTSLWTGNTVWHELGIRLPYTIGLLFLAVVISVVIAIPVGTVSAVRQDSWLDYSLRSAVIMGVSMPNFWFALLVLLVMLTVLNWSPPLDYAPIYEKPLVALEQLLLPAICLGYRGAATAARMMRSSMLEVLREDYVRTARAKGLAERAVVYGHAMRNAILPVVTIFGLEVLYLISGTVIIENIFSIPGVGGLLVTGIGRRDVVLVQGVLALIVVIVLFINLLVDLIYAWVDPRVRLE